jgi:formyltetrahydrofolate synthetase
MLGWTVLHSKGGHQASDIVIFVSAPALLWDVLFLAGTPLPHAYLAPDVEMVKAGCSNLQRHIENTLKYGVPVVVAINAFATDSPGVRCGCMHLAQGRCYCKTVHVCVCVCV